MLPRTSRPVVFPRRPSLQPAGLLATAMLLAGLPAQIVQPQPVTLTAVAAGASTSFPDASGDFEYSAVAPNQFLKGPLPNPQGTLSWAPWTMNAGAGIASNGSLFNNQNPPAPQTGAIPGGTRVALLQGFGTMSTPFTFAPGTWRLRFQGAQRKQLGVANRQVLRIAIGGVEVFEEELSGTDYRVYTTRAMRFTASTAATVTFQGMNPFGGDNTAFLDKIELEPIADWQSAGSWSPQIVPTAANDVVIPQGVEVAMRGQMQAATVTNHGELLSTFDDADLETRWLMVSNPGSRFEVGRERTPFAQEFELVLIGNDPNENVMNAGTKFLMAMDGGVIDMHGLHKRSWTRLNEIRLHPVPVGSPAAWSIRVDDPTGWQVDDEIVVAYTGHVSHTAGPVPGGNCVATYTGPRSQQRRITLIDPQTGDIYLDSGLNPAEHCTAQPTNYANPTGSQSWQLDERAEVGSLSRNVRIRGSATGTFGAHVMIMACCDQMPTGFARIANVEMTQMGQDRKLGRYPMHWHMVRDAGNGQYLRNSAIHHSHNRAITVHGSFAVEVSDNVCFDILGHAVFLEDGVERDNSFVGNLVLSIHKPADCAAMLPHDNSLDQPQNRSPAAFWISHPDNHFVGNVAADSLGVGYWFALHTFPTGTSQKAPWNTLPEFQNVNASILDLGTFADNTAHSIKMGVDVHDSVRDNAGIAHAQQPCFVPPGQCAPPTSAGSDPLVTRDDPLDDDIRTNWQWQPSQPAVLTGFTAFGCTTGIYTGGGIEYVTKVSFEDCVLADNGVQVQFASADTLRNSLLVHDSGNQIFPTGLNGMNNGHIQSFEKGNAYVVYDGPGSMLDCHLVGYDGAGAGNLCFSDFGAARRHTNHQWGGLTFAGGQQPNVVFRDFTAVPPQFPALAHPHVWGLALVDQDGSLKGSAFAGYTLISNHPMMHIVKNGLSLDEPLGATAWLSPLSWGHLQVRFYDGAQMNQLLEGMSVPSTSFERQEFTYRGTRWPKEPFDSTYVPSAQMRQLPVIVGSAGTTQCAYAVTLDLSNRPNLKRVDISLDDAAAGKAVTLYVRKTQSGGSTWTPNLYVNDNPALIHINGQHPSTLTALPSGLQPGVTSYRMRTIGGQAVLELQMVNPAAPVPLGRTHRITVTW